MRNPEAIPTDCEPVEVLLRQHGIELPPGRLAEFRENHADLHALILAIRQAAPRVEEASN